MKTHEDHSQSLYWFYSYFILTSTYKSSWLILQPWLQKHIKFAISLGFEINPGEIQ